MCSGVARVGFQGFWNPPLGGGTGYNFKRNEILAVKENKRKKIKSIPFYFDGYICYISGLISLYSGLFYFNSITMRKIIRGPCVYKLTMWDSAPFGVS